MARKWLKSTDIIHLSTPIITAVPLACAAKIRLPNCAPTGGDGSHHTIWMHRAAASDQGWYMELRSTGLLRVGARDAGASTSSESTGNPVSDREWHWLFGQWPDDTNRHSSIDLGTPFNNPTERIPTTQDSVRFGAGGAIGSLYQNTGHEIEQVAVWNVADLTDEEKAAIVHGDTPLWNIRPLSLVSCVSLRDGEIYDHIAGRSYLWTNNGPVDLCDDDATAERNDQYFGSAAADATASGVTLTATSSLIAGSASGAADGTANGATIVPTVSMIPGAASAASTAAAVTIGPTVSLIAGTATANPAVVVNAATRYQRIDGWEATTGTAALDPADPTLYDPTSATASAAMIDLLVNELGVNRLQLPIRSGWLSDADYFAQWVAGSIVYEDYRASRYETIHPGGTYYFGEFDWICDNLLAPFLTEMAARGEVPQVGLVFIDFVQAYPVGYDLSTDTTLYAQIVKTYHDRLISRMGVTPDSVDILLEPENCGGWNNGTRLGNAIVSLRAALPNVHIIAPSMTAATSTIAIGNDIEAVSGALAAWGTVGYHRYDSPSSGDIAAIKTWADARGKKTGQTEWFNATIDTIFEDVLVGGVSLWQKWATVSRTSGASPSTYYWWDDNCTNLQFATNSSHMQLFFRYVRQNADRIAASLPGALASIAAFENPNGKMAVVIKRTSASGSVDFSGLQPGPYGVRHIPNASTTAQDNTDVDVAADGTVTATIPQGYTTLYARNATTGLGQMLAAVVSLVAGAASGASTAAGVTITATATITAGTALADAQAAGATLTPAVSLVAGSASGETAGTAGGATITVAAAVIAGSASADSTVGGVTLAAVVSLIPGSATGEGNATAGGVTFAPAVSLLAGAAVADSAVPGVTMTVVVSLSAGSASGAGSATVGGVTLTLTSSLQAGSAAASSQAPGDTVAPSLTLLAGTAEASSDAAGITSTIVASLLAGAASGAGSANVPGVTLTAAQSFIAGAVTAASLAQGALAQVMTTLIPGDAYDVPPFVDAPSGTHPARWLDPSPVRPRNVQFARRPTRKV